MILGINSNSFEATKRYFSQSSPDNIYGNYKRFLEPSSPLDTKQDKWNPWEMFNPSYTVENSQGHFDINKELTESDLERESRYEGQKFNNLYEQPAPIVARTLEKKNAYFIKAKMGRRHRNKWSH